MYSREKIIKMMHEIKDESDTMLPYVVIAQPRRDLNDTPAQKLNGNDGIHIDLLGYSHGFCNIGGEVVDVARNYLLERVLESGAKYCLFVGEDTVLPYDGFLNLHAVAEKNPDAMVVGVYYMKLSSPMIMVKKENYIIPADVTPGQVYEAWQTGLDCALIPVKILKAMKEDNPEIPFCCIAHQIDDLPFIGEDNFFVYRLRKLGFKLLVNTDVQCLHMDLATGKYTAHPDVNLKNYFTSIPITVPLVMEDKEYIDKRWSRPLLPQYNKNINGIGNPVKNLVVGYSKETESKVTTLLKERICTQNYYEVSQLCEHLGELKPKTILEIGVEDGGSMRVWSEFATSDALCIGLDIDPKVANIKLENKEQKFIFVEGNSREDATLEKIREILNGREVDFLFIDGGHDELTVRNDFQKYSTLVRDGGIIAFHDTDVSLNKDLCTGIKKLWGEINKTYEETEEFVNTEAEVHFGIGMLRWKKKI